MSLPRLRSRIGRALRTSRARLRAAVRDALCRLRGAPDGLPIPPASLHVLVSGNANHGVAEFFEVGAWCAGLLEAMLGAEGTRLVDIDSILDFGCGCGRVLRAVRQRSPARLVGSDVNAVAIDWCRRSLPIGEFQVNGSEPPLPWTDGSFGLVYTFSVFTHLTEELQRPWIDELVRVLRPGGYLLLTTMGEEYEPALRDEERRVLRERGIYVRGASFAGTNECLVYHTTDYVRRALATGMEIRGFEPGTVLDARRQLVGVDAYLLRKPSPRGAVSPLP